MDTPVLLTQKTYPLNKRWYRWIVQIMLSRRVGTQHEAMHGLHTERSRSVKISRLNVFTNRYWMDTKKRCKKTGMTQCWIVTKVSIQYWEDMLFCLRAIFNSNNVFTVSFTLSQTVGAQHGATQSTMDSAWSGKCDFFMLAKPPFLNGWLFYSRRKIVSIQ